MCRVYADDFIHIIFCATKCLQVYEFCQKGNSSSFSKTSEMNIMSAQIFLSRFEGTLNEQ